VQLNLAIMALLLACTAGCSHDLGIRDEFRMADYQPATGDRERIELAAPVIVLGTVVGVTNVGHPRISPGDPRIKTQLTRIRISVEQIIKGAPSTSALEFYFFAYSSQNTVDLGVRRYVPQVGQHRIYFLKPWRRTFRSVGDVVNYTVSTANGNHKPGFCQGKEPGCCIAEVLLVPEPDRDTSRFALDLWRAAFTASEFCSPSRVRELVKALTRDPDPQVSGGAADAVSGLEHWWPELKSAAH
jgi:hypothetical protein